MSIAAPVTATAAGNAPDTEDLGPLAWVFAEIQKSLEAAGKSLRRFARESAQAQEADAGALRQVRQQLHQAVGALQMVGQGPSAHVLGAMEFAAQGFVLEPARCTEAAVHKLDRAGFAVIDFLQAVLVGKQVSPVALFPQYRDVLELVGNERIHPADLWGMSWHWVDVAPVGADQPALVQDPAVRSRLDREVLKVVKNGDDTAAHRLLEVCAGLSRGADAARARSFWALAGGFFEALALALIPADVYVKRAASRILLQYATLARGDSTVSERLAQDLLFFCAQAAPAARDAAPTLRAVREAWGIAQERPIDYASEQFGRFDPVVLAQSRKRIEAAKEVWSALAGGDMERARQAVDTFAQLTESLQKLHPPSLPLAQALTSAVDASLRTARPPSTELAMEVATSVLYLEAAFEDLDPRDRQLSARTVQLAGRIDRAREGGRSEPLEPWMEELYRRISDRHTMGTVVDELRSHLAELEKSMDQFFRRPAEKGLLRNVPGQLMQMRGVFSVLGLDQAAQTVQRMRDQVDHFIADTAPADAAKDFDSLGNNLGALGFLIDMLGYQPALAKQLFVFDAQAGELRPLMGRRVAPAEAGPAAAPMLSPEEVDAQIALRLAALAAPTRHAAAPIEEFSRAADSWTAKIAGPAPFDALPHTTVTELDEEDLQNIFLDEAREVVQNGLSAAAMLGRHPDDLAELTVLRRAFHTLKGSSRMVGLSDFGHAAWAMEQVFNTWLADQRAATPPLLEGAGKALRDFADWVEAIAANRPHAWHAEPFRQLAAQLQADEAAEKPPRTDAHALAAAARHMAAEEEVGPSVAEAAPPSPSEAPSEAVPAALDAPAPDSAAPSWPDLDFTVAVDEPPRRDTGFDDFPSTDFLGLEGAPRPVPEAQAEAALPIDASIDFLAAMPAPADAAFAPTALALPAEFALDLPAAETAPAAPQPAPAEADAGAPAPDEAEAPDEAAARHDLPQAPAAEPAAGVFTPPLAVDDEASAASDDDSVKVIGPLRIGIALYNVYLNEADEWSRALLTRLEEWALEPAAPMADATIALAHSLAGSSATVGFQGLSGMARLLETALQHLRLQGRGDADQGTLLVVAAEEVRRLLHQFAAGFLKEPAEPVLQSLRALAATPLPPESAESNDSADAVDAQPLAESLPAGLPVLPQGSADVLLEDAEASADVADAVDAELFPIFEEEADELLPQLDAALRGWLDRPADPAARARVLRALHTLKGSARLAGAMRLGERAHRMESTIQQLDAPAAGRAEIGQLVARLDALRADFERLRAPDGAAPQETDPQAADAAPTLPVSEPPAAQPAGDGPPASPAQTVPEEEEAPAAAESAPASSAAPLPPPAIPSPTLLAPLRPVASHAVRIRTHLLDRLVMQAGEVIITRARLETELVQLRASLGDLSGNLERLRQQLRDVELQAESQMQSRLAQAKDSQQAFDPLEFDRFTRVQELTRMMAESVNDVATVQRTLQKTVQSSEDGLTVQARLTRELQRGLLRTRMVEFEGISDRLYRVVRQASKDTGRPVRLDIVGGNIEMDRSVLDRMTPAFEHLLRNCVAHGIEDASARERAGKEPTGRIVVALHQEGNDVSVSFSDDGAGLDVKRIAQRARALELIGPNEQITPERSAELIFLPGFTTVSQVSEYAGRGVGMDVVRTEVTALGGRIETHSARGQGSTFKLVLPLTTAVTHVVMMRASEISVGVPSNLIELVQRVDARELEKAYAEQSFDFGGESIPFFWAGALLQSSAHSERAPGRASTVVIVRSAARRVALHVDEVLGNQEVVVKNLGPQLSRLPGMAGISVLVSGAIALIYNPVALAVVHGDAARRMQRLATMAAEAAPAAGQGGGAAPAVRVSQIPLVLVVDDSITVRRVTQRLLQREGYRVALAADGLQALERLQEERPVLVLSDIEMPRMDGFDLARNIRADAQMADLPIIMITSRIAEKHREHAKQLGVNHYLGKPYSEEELLRLVRGYTTATAAGA